jgi:hypothetical protein
LLLSMYKQAERTSYSSIVFADAVVYLPTAALYTTLTDRV